MACRLDPDLLRHDVSVDDFTQPTLVFMLTHAHSDHMKGLTKHFKTKKNGAKIYTTQVTCDLSRTAVKGLELDDFVIIPYDTPHHLNDTVTVWAFPAYHCDGSCMFLFEINAKTGDEKKLLRILYTGDFRFHPEMRHNDLIMESPIDRLYYDDRFDEIDTPFPTYAESVIEIMDVMTELLDKDKRRTIYINVSILGIEPLLREIADTEKLVFGLSKHLQTSWRGEQLKYLLEHRLDSTKPHRIMLGHRDKDHVPNNVWWIVPTCTYFLCNEHEEKKKNVNRKHVWFCTHSNQMENNRFKSLVGAVQVNPCGESSPSTELQCNRTKTE
jgi:hypothetical protein